MVWPSPGMPERMALVVPPTVTFAIGEEVEFVLRRRWARALFEGVRAGVEG